VPRVTAETPLRQAVFVLNRKNLGAVLIVSQANKVLGILTDGDLRRLLADDIPIKDRKAADVMTPNPKSVGQNLLAADALSIMQQHEVTILPVLDGFGELLGILHLHDLLGKGEFRLLV